LKPSIDDRMADRQEEIDHLQELAEEEIRRGGNLHATIVPLSKEFQAMTLELLTELGKVETALEEIAGLDSETGELRNKKEVVKTTAYMMGKDPAANAGSGNGAAHQLRQKLDRLVSTGNARIRELDPPLADRDTLRAIAVDPDIPYPYKVAPQARVSWESRTFSGVPVIVSLLHIEKLKMDVSKTESAFMDALKHALGDPGIKIDSLIAVDAPISRMTAAGMTFEASLYTVGAKGGKMGRDSGKIVPIFINGKGDTTFSKMSYRKGTDGN
jgi:hypothetical protein